jgi:hypothetical protein
MAKGYVFLLIVKVDLKTDDTWPLAGPMAVARTASSGGAHDSPAMVGKWCYGARFMRVPRGKMMSDSGGWTTTRASDSGMTSLSSVDVGSEFQRVASGAK